MTAVSCVNLIPLDELFSPSVSLAVDTKKHKLDKLQSNWSSPIIRVSLMSFCYREHSKPQSFALFPISPFQEILKKLCFLRFGHFCVCLTNIKLQLSNG